MMHAEVLQTRATRMSITREGGVQVTFMYHFIILWGEGSRVELRKRITIQLQAKCLARYLVNQSGSYI